MSTTSIGRAPSEVAAPEAEAASSAPPVPLVRRFSGWTCLTHAVLMGSVFGLAFTGMPLKYPDSFWARPLMALWGGAANAGLLHRGFAITFFAAGGMHLAGLVVAAARRRFPPVTGPDTIVPRLEDVRHIREYVRYLRGRGPQPRFGKFTYWEKFDYLAEIWGLLVIGLSGLVMWFPDIAARVAPGWAVNAALIFHSYEALLAMAFLFTIHFFNVGLRPDVFPADTSIFSGVIPEHEAAERYPGWYARLKASGQLRPEPEPHPRTQRASRRIAVTFLSLGIVMLILVMSSALIDAARSLMETLR